MDQGSVLVVGKVKSKITSLSNLNKEVLEPIINELIKHINGNKVIIVHR